MTGVATGRPLPTLLSHVLVAFTIEFDNESEHQLSHWTTRAGKPATRGAAWLASQVMWANVMQFVSEEGVRVGELHARARTRRHSLAGLQRWGYIVVKADPADVRTKPPGDDLVVRPTAAGRRAQAIWRPLVGIIEERWQERFGADGIESLRESLQRVASQLDADLPCYLPIVYPTMNGRADIPAPRDPASASAVAGVTPDLDLSALLSQVLLSFTLDFERESRISLPISANTLRVLNETGVRVRDLPRLTGVSKEANSMCVGFLQRDGCVVVEPDPSAGRGKLVRLTAKGQKAQDKYRRILGATELSWDERFGRDVMANLRGSLERLVGGEPTAQRSPLFQALEPYPDGWRASVRTPDTLPHYPMVLHRGGYPDGS